MDKAQTAALLREELYALQDEIADTVLSETTVYLGLRITRSFDVTVEQLTVLLDSVSSDQWKLICRTVRHAKAFIELQVMPSLDRSQRELLWTLYRDANVVREIMDDFDHLGYTPHRHTDAVQAALVGANEPS
jgi:hypothetical protein